MVSQTANEKDDRKLKFSPSRHLQTPDYRHGHDVDDEICCHVKHGYHSDEYGLVYTMSWKCRIPELLGRVTLEYVYEQILDTIGVCDRTNGVNRISKMFGGESSPV